MKNRVLLIKAYHELLGEKLRWDTSKVRWMMDSFNLQEDELAAEMLLTTKSFQRMLHINSFPGPVKLLLFQKAVQVGFYAPNA